MPAVEWQVEDWVRPTRWERDMTGVGIRLPRAVEAGRTELIRALAGAVGGDDWVEVRGPDSMILR